MAGGVCRMRFSGSEDLESDTLLDGTSYILCGCRRSQRSSAEVGNGHLGDRRKRPLWRNGR